MRINGVQLNSLQCNFLKELMGDIYMPDVRAESIIARLCQKFDVDMGAVAQAINKNFEAKNSALKKLDLPEFDEVN